MNPCHHYWWLFLNKRGVKTMKSKIIAIFLSTALLSACATLFGKDSDTLTIHSNDPQAKILVNGNQIGTGTATYTLVRPQTANITASKKGCNDMTVPTQQAFNPTAIINTICALCWLVDAATGKMHLTEPTDYTVTPNCDK